MRRHDFEGEPIDQAVALEPLQRLRQHRLADAANGAPQFAEATRHLSAQFRILGDEPERNPTFPIDLDRYRSSGKAPLLPLNYK